MAEGLSECTVTSESGPDTATLHVEGELIAATSEILEGAVNACLRSAPRLVAVDLAHVRFMDSAGITALLNCRGRATAQRARLTVIRPNRTLIRLMRPEIRALLAVVPEPPPGDVSDRAGTQAESRVLRCLACGGMTAHVRGPTTRGADGSFMVQWWSCTECDEGNTVLD